MCRTNGVLCKRTPEKGVKPIKGRLFEGYIDLRGGSMVYFVRGEDCRGLLRIVGRESHIG